MKKTILILDSDLQYAKKISNYGIKYKGKEFIFVFFSDVVFFEKYQNENPPAIAIVNIDMVPKLKNLQTDILFIMTNEKNCNELKLKDDAEILKNGTFPIKYIYKYSSAEEIFDTCINEYIKISPFSQGNKSKIYLVFSPIGRCGKTIFSYAFAHELSKTNSVLYISLNNYESMGSKTGLSQIIYNYKVGKLSYENIKEQIISHNNLSILYGVAFPEDLYMISPEELDKIINEISNIMSYDYIILDCDNNYLKAHFLFSSCDKIIFPTLKDDVSKEKKSKFLNFIKEENSFDTSKILEIDMSLAKDVDYSSNASINRSIIKKAKKVCSMV